MKLMSQYKGGVNQRRQKALLRLQEQLKTGKKPLDSSKLKFYSQEDYKEFIELGYIPLEEKDVKRIRKEIETLKSKI